jgi:tRNA pseudouridine38-40 synthase
MTRMTVRWRLDVAYDGTDFAGWARQPGRRTVQETLETAITTVLRLDVAPLTVAGRTDAGVHARGQVCHVDLPADLAPLHRREPLESSLLRRLGQLLPADVRVTAVRPAVAGFDARFSASWRRYAYRICDDRARVDPLRRREVLAWPRRLDVEAMETASAGLVGVHDFAAFCRQRAGATTIRSLLGLTWRRADGLVVATVTADAFCHQMVRSLVGAMLVVGEGRRAASWPAEVLQAGVRDPLATPASAHGLTLEEVGYPPDAELAARALQTRAVRIP